MTALTGDRRLERRDGVELDFPVAAATRIYGGALVATNTSGYLVPGGDTAGYKFAGVASGWFDNTSGANGELIAVVRRRGVINCAIASAVQADVGKSVFLADDQTVAFAAGTENKIYVGVIAGVIDGTNVWVDIDRAGVYPTT